MRAVVTFRGPEAGVVRSSLAPEAGREIPGCSVSVGGEEDVAEITIEAADVGALRAAVNSYLRWSQVALEARRAVRA